MGSQDGYRRLLASLTEVGQQTPIVVVAAEGPVDRYLLIDGHRRLTALQQLGRDTVEAVIGPMSEAGALVLDSSMCFAEHETALERGRLLAELEQRNGFGKEELARRLDRSLSFVSGPALVDLLPEAPGSKCLLVTLVSGNRRRPVPPARTMPFRCHPPRHLKVCSDPLITASVFNPTA